MKLDFRLVILILPFAALLTAAYSALVIAGAPNKEVKPAVLPKLVATHAGCMRTDRIFATGKVEPVGGVVQIAAFESGIVGDVFVRSGELVGENEPLFKLNDTEATAEVALYRRELEVAVAKLGARRADRRALRAEVKMIEAALEAAKSEHNYARALGEMADRLESTSSISLKEYRKRQFEIDRTRARVAELQAKRGRVLSQIDALEPGRNGSLIAVNKAEIERASSRLNLAKARLEKLTVRAPVTGRIMEVAIRKGEFVEPGLKSQVLLWPDGKLHLRIELDELDQSRFSRKLTATAKYRSTNKSELTLKYARIEPFVTPKRTLESRLGGRTDSRAINVLYEVEGNDLLPGQVFDVFIGGSVCPDPSPERTQFATNG